MEGNPALRRLTYYRQPPLFTGVQIGLLFTVETDAMQFGHMVFKRYTGLKQLLTYLSSFWAVLLDQYWPTYELQYTNQYLVGLPGSHCHKLNWQSSKRL